MIRGIAATKIMVITRSKGLIGMGSSTFNLRPENAAGRAPALFPREQG
jgi:hypothetical protein